MLTNDLGACERRVLREQLGARLREVRLDLFGVDRGPSLAALIGVSARTWLHYEQGITVPAEVALAFLDVTGCCPRWLLYGYGRKYLRREPRTSAPPKAQGPLGWDEPVPAPPAA